MANKIFIGIPDPCHENWNQMSPADKGRFCASCQKTVVDFTYSTDKEIVEFLSKSGDSVCGRFDNRQLNRPLVNAGQSTLYVSAKWSMMLAGMLAWGVSQAQTEDRNVKGKVVMQGKPVINPSDVTVPLTIPSNLSKITGRVLNAKDMTPIPYATILIKGTKSGTVADSNGRFVLTAAFEGDNELALQVSCIGFAGTELLVKKSKGELSFYLEPQTTLLGEVVVADTVYLPVKTCVPDSEMFATVGMIVQRHEPDLQDKIGREIEKLIPQPFRSKAISIAPNPIVSGSAFYMMFNPGRTGDYTIDIFSTNGVLMQRKFIHMDQPSQQLEITTGWGWSSGMYWVRVSGEKDKVYQTRLVIQ